MYRSKTSIDAYTLNIQGYKFIATKQITTIHDFMLNSDKTVGLRTGNLFSETSTFGDYIKIEIVDKDGIYYPINTIVSEYISKFYIMKTQLNNIENDFIVDIPSKLYLRIHYTSSSSAILDADVCINLYTFLINR